MIKSECIAPPCSFKNNATSFLSTLCFRLLIVTIIFFGIAMVAGCSSNEDSVDTNGAGNVSPEWYSGSVVNFSQAESTVTMAIDEPKLLEVDFSLEKMSDRYKEWVFSTIELGDTASASCLSELVEKGSGVNIAVSFRIKGLEDQEARISEIDVSEAISNIRTSFRS
ncbi:hypothetical protein [Gordonibacter urolithinfaciens]|uniref:hypothetical protein n=1 Tax=Gordonibacter urolithinfaciens TaxID=1335613 RepID=UPI001D9DBB56|nr:hypothetical protein [Gordonibacter urolithinfaciens]HJF62121.1 hypothetical protein [Gordonibacter urolithinfaciens]